MEATSAHYRVPWAPNALISPKQEAGQAEKERHTNLRMSSNLGEGKEIL